MIIEQTKKNAALIPLWGSDFRATTTPRLHIEIKGKPIPLNKAKGPGIIPIPNIAGSLGMSSKPPETIAR